MQDLGPWLAPYLDRQVEVWAGGQIPSIPGVAVRKVGAVPRTFPLFRWFNPAARYYWEQRTMLPGMLVRLRRLAVDLVYCGDPILAWDLKRFRRRTGTRVVFMNGMRLTPKWLRSYNGIHLLAPAYLEEAKLLLGPDAAKPFFAVPHFADTKRFRPAEPEQRMAARRALGLPCQTPIWLTLGPVGTESRKRLDHVAAEVARSSSEAILVSAGGDELGAKEVKEKAMQVLGSRMRFLACVDRERVPELYHAADAYVLGSLAEPFSIAILEALASGLPVVHHPDAVMTWQTGDGGVQVSMEEQGAAGAQLKRLGEDAEWRLSVGRAARELAENRYAPDRVAKDLALCFDRILRDKVVPDDMPVRNVNMPGIE